MNEKKILPSLSVRHLLAAQKNDMLFCAYHHLVLGELDHHLKRFTGSTHCLCDQLPLLSSFLPESSVALFIIAVFAL